MRKKSVETRFLLDENVDIRLSSFLKKKGFDVEFAPKGIKNSNLINLAKEKACILITHDKDFANSNLYDPVTFAGMIVLRIHPPRLNNLVVSLDKFLNKNKSLDFRGKIFILTGV
ncbi:DUF5615 family PIN-like protein [Candidatus Roizmanbacteria bacterium]|nr:DUF5615 family PIN-like protein [Candidatus Roizmanbacteria bacterium]